MYLIPELNAGMQFRCPGSPDAAWLLAAQRHSYSHSLRAPACVCVCVCVFCVHMLQVGVVWYVSVHVCGMTCVCAQSMRMYAHASKERNLPYTKDISINPLLR